MLHDVFNLVALGALNALNASFILSGRGFEHFWTACMVYFLIDTAFVGESLPSANHKGGGR